MRNEDKTVICIYIDKDILQTVVEKIKDEHRNMSFIISTIEKRINTGKLKLKASSTGTVSLRAIVDKKTHKLVMEKIKQSGYSYSSVMNYYLNQYITEELEL